VCGARLTAGDAVQAGEAEPGRRDPLPDHLRVFTAIAAKDAPKAQKAMSELIELALARTPRASSA